MPDYAEIISNNIRIITQKIRAAEIEFNRPVNSVSLLAASKSQTIEKIKAAIAAGQRRFGENYSQEALSKIQDLKRENSLEWHFIGSIQTNKTRMLALHFDWVHGVSTAKVAEALNRYRSTTQPPLNVCIQINVDLENSKSGIFPGKETELFELVQMIRQMDRLQLRGLMAIPAPSPEFNQQRARFARVADLKKAINHRLQETGAKDLLDTLSLGMSDDFVAAIAAGSTMVRVGTAIFGAR